MPKKNKTHILIDLDKNRWEGTPDEYAAFSKAQFHKAMTMFGPIFKIKLIKNQEPPKP